MEYLEQSLDAIRGRPWPWYDKVHCCALQVSLHPSEECVHELPDQ